MNDLSADELSGAVVLWTGFGETWGPVRDDERVVRRFGSEAAATLVPELRRLENVRVPESLHRELALSAAQEGVSLNRLVSDRLARS